MAGAEVIETHSNWNYSRSLLFAWAIPYYHMGLRAVDARGQALHGGIPPGERLEQRRGQQQRQDDRADWRRRRRIR